MHNNYGFERNFFILLILMAFFLPFVQGDIISVNSGGSESLVVTPDRYIEGFFFLNIVCGDGLIEGSEQCDDGNAEAGDGCSATCQTEPPVVDDDDGAGAGGGGVVANISVDPDEFNVNLAISTTKEESILVTNLGSSELTVNVRQEGLDSYLILGASNLTMQPGQSSILNVVFVALSDPEIVTGKIIIGGKTVLVTLNIQSTLLLFDSNIVVLNENFKVEQGDDLETLVTLIPFGDPTRLDVTLDFTIRDFRNQIYLTKSETLLVERQINLERNFETGFLPVGDYVVGLVLKYPNGVAPSSASFEVIEKVPLSIFGRLILFLIILILLVLILIIIIIIIKKLRERRENNPSPPGPGFA